MQQGHQLVRVRINIEQHQRAQLGIPILLDDEHDFVLLDEIPHRLAERKSPHPAVVQVNFLLGQPVTRFDTGAVAAADSQ